MDRALEDKIHTTVKQQARYIARHDLLHIGKGATYGLFALLMVIVAAAAASSSIDAKANSPNADSVFYHLQKISVQDIEKMLKKFVIRSVKLLKRRFGNRKFAVAIDYTDEMYYGDKNNALVVGTKHKNGSNYAFKYLTVNIVVKGCRFFLFAYPIFQRGDNWKNVERVLDLLEELELKTYVLLLDREFNDSKTLNLLDGREYSYLIPADQDSKFIRWKRSVERFPAIFRGWSIANSAETNFIAIEEDGHVYGYLTNLPEKFYSDDVSVLSNLYSKRWGIETAHRVEDKFRIYTTTRNGIFRYLFFVISVLIYNIWVWANFIFGIAGNFRVTVDNIKEIFSEMFTEFFRWLLSPERWFTFGSVGPIRRELFLCNFGRQTLHKAAFRSCSAK